MILVSNSPNCNIKFFFKVHHDLQFLLQYLNLPSIEWHRGSNIKKTKYRNIQ